MRWFLAFVLIVISGPAWAAKAISYSVVSPTPTVEQDASYSVVFSVTNTGDEVFPVSDLADALYLVYNDTEWRFVPSRDTLRASTSTIPVLGSLAVTVGVFNQVSTADVKTHFMSVQIGSSDVFASTPPPSTLLQVAVTAPSAAPANYTELAQYVPAANEFAFVPNTSLTGWTDECTGVSGDHTDGPCQGGGLNTIFTTAAELATYSPDIQEVTGPVSIVGCWGDAAWDPMRSRFYMKAGGHTCYRGGEMYMMQLTDPITFARMQPPSQLTRTGNDIDPVGIPVGDPKDILYPAIESRPGHDYGGMVWTQAAGGTMGRVFIFSTLPMGERFDPGQADPVVPGSGFSIHPFIDDVIPYATAVYSYHAKQVCMVRGRDNNGTMFCYDPQQAATVAGYEYTGPGSQGFYEPGGRVPYDNGMMFASANIGIAYTDMRETFGATVKGQTRRHVFWADFPTTLNYQTGAALRGDVIYFWDGDNDVHKFDIKTKVWTLLTPGGAVPSHIPVGGGGNANTVFGKWQYIPDLDVFVGLHNPDQGIVLYKPPAFPSFATMAADPSVLLADDLTTLPPEKIAAPGDLEGMFNNDGTCASLTLPQTCPQIAPVDCLERTDALIASNCSGQGYMRFSMLNGADLNDGGQVFFDFANSSGDQIEAGEEVYVRWEQYFTADYITRVFEGGGGWKQLILGQRDGSSCSNNELVVQNTLHRGYPQMYHACGIFAGFEFQDPKGTSDFSEFDYQPGGPVMCFRNETPSNCTPYLADQWLKFKLDLKYSTDGRDRVKLWMAREGGGWELLIDYVRDLVDTANGYGRVWLLNYNSGQTATSAPDNFTWYRNLIVSTNPLEG